MRLPGHGAQEDPPRLGERRRRPTCATWRKPPARAVCAGPAGHGREDRGEHPAGHRDLDGRGGRAGPRPPAPRRTWSPRPTRFVEALRALPQVVAADFAGSLRRCRSTVRDIDLVVASTGAGRRHGRLRHPARAGPGGGPGRHQADRRHLLRPERGPAGGAPGIVRRPAAALHRQCRPQRGAARVRAAPRLQDQRVLRGAPRVRAPHPLRHRGRGVRDWWACATSPRNCGRTRARSRRPKQDCSRTWSTYPICAATCMSTPTGPTDGPPWSRWPSPPATRASSTCASATTRSRWP